jgi:hypothetical protein
MDAETVARELYELRPGEFIAARDAKAAEARGAGERELAAEIKSMRRPTVTAWVMNLFALQRGERLEQLFSLGTALREAQASLSGDTLRRLDQQRRQVVGALAGEAAALAAQHGQPASPQVVADVEQTLYAALADEDAAVSVRAGQLTTGLRYTGFGDVAAAATAPKRAPGAAPRKAEKKRDGDAEDRRKQQQALDQAERALERASAAAEQSSRRLENAREQSEQASRAVEALEAQLGDARSRLGDTERDVNDAEAESEQAKATLDDARDAVESTRAGATER